MHQHLNTQLSEPEKVNLLTRVIRCIEHHLQCVVYPRLALDGEQGLFAPNRKLPKLAPLSLNEPLCVFPIVAILEIDDGAEIHSFKKRQVLVVGMP